MSKTIASKQDCIVICRDVQEKRRYWEFSPTEKSGLYLRTDSVYMQTGDYTIKGLEDVFTIERKASTGEIAGNLPSKRFENELKRMQLFDHAYIICEFTLEDLYRFPYNSTIPPRYWRKLRTTSGYLVKRIIELEATYKARFIYAGNKGKDIAEVIFRQMIKNYSDQVVRE